MFSVRETPWSNFVEYVFSLTMPKHDSSPRKFFLREWRRLAGLSQEEFAELVEMDRTSISKIESGRVGFTEAFLNKAAKVLGCEPADLLMHNPTEFKEIVTVFRQIPENQRAQALRVLKSFANSDENDANSH